MDTINKLKTLMENDKKSLLLSISRAKEARDKAPSAMESHSDSTRSQNEKLVDALEEQLKELNQRLTQFPTKIPESKGSINIWSVATLKNSGNEMSVMLVPEGFGGKKIDNILTITEKAPLGSAIKGKKMGENYEINGNTGLIVSLV